MKEQVLSIADRLKVLPASAIIKVMMIFLRPALAYWKEQADMHGAALFRYPEGSSMRVAVEKKYREACVNWHRLNYLSLKLEESEAFKSFDAPRFQKKERFNSKAA